MIEMINELLKCLDCFGTKFNFYTEKNRKFYTPLGGIFSLLAFFFSVLIFIFLNFEDFLHTAPVISTSVLRENYSNIKFGQEQIWLPWRIRDYNNRKIDHSNLFYPIIYYYKGIKNESTQGMELSYNIISYKLCNETSMVNRSSLFMINISLDNFYCIDMDDLKMGGNWQADFINYIEFDLYLCKDGLEYNDSIIECSSYEKIIEAAKGNNSFEFEILYPEVYYEPTNQTTPIIVKYSSHFYQFSRYSNKIDRLFLQKYILSDDAGWFHKSITNYSYWGCTSITGDSYTTGGKNDLMNEGSSSRIYSFNIYLKDDIIYYNRSYKKIFIMVADRLPLVNIVCVFFSLIAKIFKVSSGNKKLTELLFENLKEKPIRASNKINNEPFNVLKIRGKSNHQSVKIFNSIKNNLSNNQIFQVNDVSNITNNRSNNFFNSTNNNINDVSSSIIHLSPQHNARKKINVEPRRYSVNSQQANLIFYRKSKNNNNNLSNIISNNSFNNNINMNYVPVGLNNNNININIHNNLRNYESNKSEDFSSNQQSGKINIKKRINFEGKNTTHNINKKKLSLKTKKRYVKLKLFPYKYYLCSIFIKNVDSHKKSIFFTKKFINVYNFICQLFDISSYLILQKEFQIIKNTFGRGKYKALIENRQKINVNDNSFYTDMKECLDSNKFSILGRIKNPKDKIN